MRSAKPIILTDLDDTLFQTKRKFKSDEQFEKAVVGAFDRKNQPRSFMSAIQKNMLSWLLETAEVIPVTARGTEEIQRIAIDFNSYAITTHGAVILDKTGKPCDDWKGKILQALSHYKERLTALEQHVSNMLANPSQYPVLPNVNAWCRMNYEYHHPIYLVMKVTDSAHVRELNAYADWVEDTFDLDGFYVHRNDNNVAWLPRCIEKGQAVSYLLNQLKASELDRPILGFGDSLSDYSFMKYCDFISIPKGSQFMKKIDDQLFPIDNQ